MRDLALLAVLIVLAPLAVRFPFAGLYGWEWLSLMNPHRLGFGIARELPLNFAIATITIVAWFVSPNKSPFKLTPFGVLLIVFAVWISTTTVFAPIHDVTTPLWDRNIKTMVLALMVIVITTTQVRLIGLIWIICSSIGYFGVKGALFMVATGGRYIVWGPNDTMIYDNNSLALALVMIAPLLNYLRTHTQHKLLRLSLLGCLLLVIIGVVGSYSRGGLIALVAMAGFLWLKTRAKLAILSVAVVIGLVGLIAMPDKYFDRIASIGNAGSDESFQGRLDAWEVAWKVALDRPFGAGFDGPRQWLVWSDYLSVAKPRASHSIYFMVLGEHGFIGLFLYLALLAAGWLNLSAVHRKTQGDASMVWASDLAQAMQVSIIGFCIGGAALPMAYYDGFITILAAGAALRSMIELKLSAAKMHSHASAMKTPPNPVSVTAP